MTGSKQISSAEFDLVVAVRLGEGMVCVSSAADGLRLLTNSWPGPGASHERAVAACEAAVAGTGPAIAARATFCVAAMEAGIPFELFEDELEAMACEIAEVALADLKDGAGDQ